MLLSQKLANFTKGEADTLRKAMGKKQIDVLNKMYPKFIEGRKNNLNEERLEKSGTTGKPLQNMPSTSLTLPVMPLLLIRQLI
jgi:phage-related tail protein